MTSITDIIDNIWTARHLTKMAVDELERLEGAADTCEAENALQASYAAERDAYRELANTRAGDHTGLIMKASILIDATHGPNEEWQIRNRYEFAERAGRGARPSCGSQAP